MTIDSRAYQKLVFGALLCAVSFVTAFRPLQHHHYQNQRQQQLQARRVLSSSWQSPQSKRSHLLATSTTSSDRLNEFDFILTESGRTSTSSIQGRRRLAIALGGSNPYDEHSTLLASAVAAPEDMETTTTELTEDYDEDLEQSWQDDEESSSLSEEYEGSSSTTAIQEQEEDDDPYAAALNAQKNKMQQIQTKQQNASPRGMSNKLKEMDLSDIILTVAIPAVAVFAAGKWGYGKVSARVSEKTSTLLDSFAREMIFHDSDMTEMKMCVDDYSKRLLYLGPVRNTKMLKSYLEAFAKRKTVSPQAISSLSYVFSLFSLSEEQAASTLVSLCNDMGTDKISSAGKLLFLGSRILKSPEGNKGLEPIKKLIMSTYRDITVAETMVDTSQQAMAEAAYRATVQSGGKNQKSLTPGWEVLGLERGKAQEIFNEEAKEGFVTMRETMYKGQTTKYDKKGNIIDKEGKLVNPEEAVENEDGTTDAVSNVYECGDCGFTLFVAKGREAKFFGQNFKCPECGAKKDKFLGRDDMDDE